MSFNSDRESFDGIQIHLNEKPWFNRLLNSFFYCCISTTLTPIPQNWYYNPKLKVKQWRTLWLGVACYSLLLWSGLLSNRCPSALDVYYVTTPLNVLSTHPHSCECLFGKKHATMSKAHWQRQSRLSSWQRSVNFSVNNSVVILCCLLEKLSCIAVRD